MQNITNAATVAANHTDSNLSQPLQSSIAFPMDQCNKRTPAAGHRFARLIKKGENSKLPESLAVEVPSLTSLISYLQQPAIADYLLGAAEKLQDAYIKSVLESGRQQVQFSELDAPAIAVWLATSEEGGKLGQLSEEKIVNWFQSEARELLVVALADRLGISDADATEADVKRLEQVANQLRDNLKKLASRKPVVFDARVKDALNWALNVVGIEDAVAARLQEKLNVVVKEEDFAASLGF